MAVDNRPFKSKEQDGQGNEVIIRDQQLVEQGTTTTMPAGTYFQTLDVDGRPVKIPKDNMLNLIVEGLGIIFNGQSDQQTVTKVPTLNGNNFGASTVATLASVLGVKRYTFRPNTTVQTGISSNAGNGGMTLLAMVSGQTNNADYTYSAVVMLRCGYDGNHLTAIEIAKNGFDGWNSDWGSFTADSNGQIVFNAPGAGGSITIIMSSL